MSYFIYCEDCEKTVDESIESRKEAEKKKNKHQTSERFRAHDCYILENQAEDSKTRSDLN